MLGPETEKFLVSVGLKQSVIRNALQNKRLTERLRQVVVLAGQHDEAKGRIGPLLYKIATKVPPGFEHRFDLLTKYVSEGKIRTDAQLEAAINYVKTTSGKSINTLAFEQACGSGVEVSREQIRQLIRSLLLLPGTTPARLQRLVRERLRWADGRAVSEEIASLRPDSFKASAVSSSSSISATTGKKERLSKLLARDLASALNSRDLLEGRKAAIGYDVVTRFPPEPNGYLHIGHAKAMRHNFTLAADYGGVCYLRYDDTNPEKEHIEYIDNIQQCVKWLGYAPWKITYASDYFDQLYQFAVKMIKTGKAYVCHQTKEELAECRAKGVESPWRNRPVEESLKLFEEMREGKLDEKSAMLRLKIDMKHPNPCMRDPVAYRILKHTPHPRTKDKWCIYPTYDFTHCINDSLEHITHSCCTLEFEIRRDSYYWLLEALDLYRPYVWEFSRLNISHNVLSKRLLQVLVSEKKVMGWDDPRLLTLMGLKRRGVTPAAINEFCDLVGVTRRGNEMLIPCHLLDHCIRKDLDEKAPRTMGVVDPLEVVLTNLPEKYEEKLEASLFPKHPERGKQEYLLTKRVFIERADYRSEAGEDYRGLTRSHPVLLKFAGWVQIHWVSAEHSRKAELRLFGPLFDVEDPKKLGKDWKQGVSKDSMKVVKEAVVWDRFAGCKALDCFQFERVGYFVLDYDSRAAEGKLVFNRVVTLNESKEKREKTADLKRKPDTLDI